MRSVIPYGSLNSRVLTWLPIELNSGKSDRERNWLLHFVMFILHGHMSCSQSASEYFKRGPWVTVAATSCAIEFYCPIKFGCVHCQMACRYKGVNAHAATHNVIAYSVDQRILHTSLR